jgi:SAM-dependent methyltransferase
MMNKIIIKKCLVCGSSQSEKIYSFKNGFILYKCKKCSFKYVNPVPNLYSDSQIKKYYSDAYEPFKVDLKRIKISNFDRFILSTYGYHNLSGEPSLIKQIFYFPFFTFYKVCNNYKNYSKYPLIAFKKKGKLLDLGCGSGDYVHWTTLLGWDSYGIDASHLEIKSNLKIKKGFLKDFKFKNNHFDVILMKGSIEHMISLAQDMTKIKKILKKSGRFIIVLPNIECMESKLFGKYWYGLDIPRHLYHFSPKTLNIFLIKNGFKIEKIFYVSYPDHITRSIDLFFGIKNNSKFKFNNVLFRSLAFPLSLFLNLIHNTGTVTVFCSKE